MILAPRRLRQDDLEFQASLGKKTVRSRGQLQVHVRRHPRTAESPTTTPFCLFSKRFQKPGLLIHWTPTPSPAILEQGTCPLNIPTHTLAQINSYLYWSLTDPEPKREKTQALIWQERGILPAGWALPLLSRLLCKKPAGISSQPLPPPQQPPACAETQLE